MSSFRKKSPPANCLGLAKKKKKIHAGTKRTLNKFSLAFEKKEEKRQPLVTSVYQHAMHRVLQVHQAVPKQCTHMHTNTQHP